MGMPVESITKPHQAALSSLLRFSFEMKLTVQTHETVPEGRRNFPYVPLDPARIFPLPGLLAGSGVSSTALLEQSVFPPFRCAEGDGQKCQVGHC